MFSCEFYESFKNTFFTKHLRWLLLSRTKFGSQTNSFGIYWLKLLFKLFTGFFVVWIISSKFFSPKHASANLPCRKITNGLIGSTQSKLGAINKRCPHVSGVVSQMWTSDWEKKVVSYFLKFTQIICQYVCI